MTPYKMKIEIWSDIVCPFCYIGKKKLEQSIARLDAGDKTEIVWHSYQLDPAFPKGMSVPSMEYLSQKRGYPEVQVRNMQAQLGLNARPYAIDFQFEKSLSFNTLDAHRLWQWSKQAGLDSPFKEAMMKAYFTDGADLSHSEELLSVAESVGLDVAEAARILHTNLFEQEVEEDIYHARQIGIRGVPYFLINEKAVISGAQDDKVFEGVLRAALN